MDEELVDEASQLEVAEDYSQIKPLEYDDILQGKNVVEGINHVNTSQHRCESLFMDDADIMVEELTVKSYNGSSLDIGTSNNREQLYNQQSHCRNLFHLASNSGIGNPLFDIGTQNSVRATSSAREDIGSSSFLEMLARKSLSDGQSNVIEHLAAAENNEGAVDVRQGIRTKIISQSGFAEFFIKNNLKGKGIVYKGPSFDAFCAQSREQNRVKTGIDTDQNQMMTGIGTEQKQMKTGTGTYQSQMKTGIGPDQSQIKTGISADQNQRKNGIGTDQKPKKTGIGTHLNSNQSVGYGSKTAKFPSYGGAMPMSGRSECDGMTLREWLKHGHCKASKVESLNIFRKIVDLVDNYHSEGVALHNLCPSYIKLTPSNQIMYLGLPVQKRTMDNVVNSEAVQSDNSFTRKRMLEHITFPYLDTGQRSKKIMRNLELLVVTCVLKLQLIGNFIVIQLDCKIITMNMRKIPKFLSITLEECPASLLYLTQVKCHRLHVKSWKINGMQVLREVTQHHQISTVLVSSFLREILQSELINGLQELFSEELLSSIDQEYAESELLLHFLVLFKEQKQNNAFKLVEEIKCLESDIEEVERRHDSRKSLVSSGLQNNYSCQKEIMPLKKESLSLEMLPSVSPISTSNEVRLMRNICHLESAYFSMRSRLHLSETNVSTHPDKDILRNRENWYMAQKGEEQPKNKDTLGAFFDGLCKYARYCKFEVRGVLRNADFNNPANVICSLSFDWDADYFASCGISKKIKFFEFNSLCNDSVDIHCPAVEMSNSSKFICVCWNNCIKNYLASTGYDGIVKLWDASTGQEFSQLTEHGKRAWSVDFSVVCLIS